MRWCVQFSEIHPLVAMQAQNGLREQAVRGHEFC
jgi:hypothetical protein